MKCPRCETSTLVEFDRDGVTIDRCKDCRGLWLDRGELEKLMARAGAEQDDDDARNVRFFANDGDDDDRRPGRGRKRSWLDIFDFD
jgi:Zn-finger nucleic acid-binding protein